MLVAGLGCLSWCKRGFESFSKLHGIVAMAGLSLNLNLGMGGSLVEEGEHASGRGGIYKKWLRGFSCCWGMGFTYLKDLESFL